MEIYGAIKFFVKIWCQVTQLEDAMWHPKDSPPHYFITSSQTTFKDKLEKLRPLQEKYFFPTIKSLPPKSKTR